MLAKSERVEQQIGLVVACDAGQALHKAGANIPLAVGSGHRYRRKHACVNRGGGKMGHQFFQHIFSAAQLVQPIMHQGDR